MAEEGGLPTWGSANVNTAIVVSLGAGLATGIGGAVAFVPQIFASVKQGVILSVALAISAGVMLYVSFIEIFVKAQAEIEKSLGPSGAAATTTACFFAGMLFCVVLELLVHKCMGHGRAVPPSGAATSGTDGGSPGEVSVELGNVTAGAQDAKALTDGYAAVATSEVEQKAQLKKMGALTAVAIALHNFPEGLAVGVGFGGAAADLPGASRAKALNLALGIGLQNFPEGLAVSMPLRRSGMPASRAFLFGQLSGVVEPVGGVLGAALVLVVTPVLPYALAFAAGAMIYVVVDQLIPESLEGAHSTTGNKQQTLSFLFGFGLMMTLDVALG